MYDYIGHELEYHEIAQELIEMVIYCPEGHDLLEQRFLKYQALWACQQQLIS